MEKTYWFVVRYYKDNIYNVGQIILKAISAQEAVNKVRYDGLLDSNGEIINPYEIMEVYKKVNNWN